MCVIICKNKNDRLPTKEELKNCFDYNSDGAGFMYVNNNKIYIDKGYMTKKDFLKRFDILCKKFNNFEGKGLVIHCRITTHGGTNPHNCHPFPVSEKMENLKKLKIKSDLGIAHNGILSDFSKTEEGQSDTQKFIVDYLSQLYKINNKFYKNNKLLKSIDTMTNNKFAILDKNENVYTIGEFINEKGVLFSNTSYVSYNYYKSYDYNFYDDIEEIDENGYIAFNEEPENLYKIEDLKTSENSIFYYDFLNFSAIEKNKKGKIINNYENVLYYNKNKKIVY